MDYQNRVKELRIKKGVTQKELAEIVGTSQQQIQRIESGAIKVRLDTALKISAALGSKIEKVFFGAKDVFKKIKAKNFKEPYKLSNNEEIIRDSSLSGIELDPRFWTFLVRLKGHSEDLFFPISSSAKDRLWYVTQENDTDLTPFFSFETENKYIAINISQIVLCQTLFDFHVPMNDEKEDNELINIYFAEDEKPRSFEVESDPEYIPGKDEGEIRMLLNNLETGIEKFIRFTDVDGETVYINVEELALIEVPLEIIKPEILDAEEIEEDHKP